MWKKNELAEDSPPQPAARTSPPVAHSTPSKPVSTTPGPAAILGPSITVKGDITGDEDLLIEGTVEGAIQLRQHNVTVGRNGRVVADIHGKRICIDGEVKGDLLGDEILIRKSGRVEGNAKAPRVTLENGCNFRGSIDMKPAPTSTSTNAPGPATRTKRGRVATA